MVLEVLGKKLRKVFDKIRSSVSVDERLLQESLRDIRRALIEADVNAKLVEEICQRVEKRFKKEREAGLTERERLIKVLYEELVELLGGKFEGMKIEKKPFVIMCVGLLGSGKTTTCAKLANYFKKKGYTVGMICGDVYRAAAFEQLKELGDSIGVSVYGGEGDVFKIIEEGMRRFSKKDIIIIDTAGRHKNEKSLMEEMKKIAEVVKPDEIILVIDASIGQAARVQAEAFHSAVPIGSIIVTKLDGTAKGGGALTACAVTGAKIKFVGTGEKLDDLEPYDPKKFVSRMLGLGDLETLLEKAKEVVKPEKVEKLVEGEFTLEDFVEQLESLSKMGPLKQILEFIPGLGGRIPEELLEQQERKFKVFKYIVQSMTKEERRNPEIINSSRIRRIARGSGRSEEDVRELLAYYNKMKKLMKSFGGLAGMKRGKLKEIARYLGFKL